MKRLISLTLLLLTLTLVPAAFGESAFDVLPVPQPDPGSDFGVDTQVNMTTLDDYLSLSDAVYRDMRMKMDPYDYEAIGGNSILNGMVEGFTLIPYPLLAPCQNMPEALGAGYVGPTLFAVDEGGHFTPAYEESMDILKAIFPQDQAIVLMCGAGGYAGMTRQLLIDLGWNEGLLFNAGGFWYYEGEHARQTAEQCADGTWLFHDVAEFDVDFGALTPVAP